MDPPHPPTPGPGSPFRQPLAGTTLLSSWAFRSQFNGVVCNRYWAERVSGTIRGQRVGDVAGVRGAICVEMRRRKEDEHCDGSGRVNKRRFFDLFFSCTGCLFQPGLINLIRRKSADMTALNLQHSALSNL